MKKITLALTGMLLAGQLCFAQCTIQNNDFENWTMVPFDSSLTANLPDGWLPLVGLFAYLFNGDYFGIEQSSDAQSGSSAARMYQDTSESPPKVGGDLLTNIACDQQTQTLKGFYKLLGATNIDTAGITLQGSKYDSVSGMRTNVGEESIFFTTNQSSYTSFSHTYTFSSKPDTLAIWLIYYPYDSTVTTSFLVDNLTIETPIGVQSIDFDSDVSVYPNPATSIVNLDLKQYDVSEIRMINSNGQVMFEMKQGESEYKSIDVSSYDSGMYILEFTRNNGQRHTRQLMKK